MLDEDIQKLYTMVLPWEKYQYQSLYLGIYISPDVFQGETSTLLQEMVQMFIYMYDLVIIRNDPFYNHTNTLDYNLNLLEKQVIQYNTDK